MSSSPVRIDAAKYGPWAVIAGGSEGIGSAVARDIAAVGINSVLIARKVEPLNEVAAELRSKYGVQVRTLALDLTAESLLDRVRTVTDDIDVGLLVYNAGASHVTGPFLDWALADVVKVIRLNTIGPATLIHHFGKKMAARGRGGIMVMGSLAGNAGSPSVAAYGGAKAFEQNLGEGLWWELKQHGVDVLHVVVGSTETPAMARLGITARQNAADQPEDVARHALRNIANGPVVVVPSMQARYNELATTDRRAAVESNGVLIMGNTKGTWTKAE